MSSTTAAERDETLEALRNRIEDYERWFRAMDSQMRVLERERQKLSAVLNRTDAAFVVMDASLQVVWANHVFAKLFGSSSHPGSFAGMICREVLCRREEACEMCPASQPFRTGTVAHHEIRTEVDGETRHIYATAMPILSPEGRIDETIVMLQDVSDLTVLRRSQEALKASEESFRSIFETALDGIITVDWKGRILEFNPAAEKAFSFSRSEAIGLQIGSMILFSEPGDGEEGSPGGFPAGADGALAGRRMELAAVRKDGSRFAADVAIARIPIPGAPVFTCYVRDLTERIEAEEALRRSEEQLRQAQKMEAIGTLAGGVAHDFNNILTGVLGYAELLKLDPKAGEKVHQAADVICKAARRGAELTQQLLGFARKGKQQNVPVDMRSTIHEIVELLSRTIDKNITITQRHRARQALVTGDPGQIQQVFINLAVNARDAMPQGGELTFVTDHVRLSEEDCRRHPGASPGEYVVVSVMDTGCGIPDDLKERIFEPFFTTKERGKGTGMGLAMVYGIIKNHGGSIRVDSELRRGTSFSVYLPLAKAIELSAEDLSDESLVTGTGLVLVVDDEEAVRVVVSGYLKHLGYEVLTAADGKEAIDIYLERGADIDLVVMDLVMPRLGGRECFRILKRIDPGVKAILSTGYGFNVAAQEMIDEGMLGFVQKPYEMIKLSEVVAKALRK